MGPFLRQIGVTRVADITGLDSIGLPVAVAYRPNARSLVTSHGKGVSVSEAKTSAVMEALERHCAENPKIPLRYSSWAELADEDRVVDLDSLPRIVETPPSKTRRTLWAQATGMITGSNVWVPFETVHLDYALPLPTNLECLHIGSGGLASGNSFNEAAVCALAELIERDALTLWRSKGTEARETAVDTQTIEDPWCSHVLDALARSGVGVAVWDMTSDLGVPAFYCEIWSDDASAHRGVGAAGGSACHPRREIALAKALLEAVQSRLTMISATRDDLTREMFVRGPWHERRDEETTRPARSFTDIDNAFDCESIDQALEGLVDRVEAVGHVEPLKVDLSHEGIPAAVVRVLAPGLEGSCDAPGYMAGSRASRIAEARKVNGDRN